MKKYGEGIAYTVKNNTISSNGATILIELTQPSETLRKAVITLSAQTEELDTITATTEVKFIMVPKITLGDVTLVYEDMPANIVQVITVPVTTEDIEFNANLNVRLVKDGVDIPVTDYTVIGNTTDSEGKTTIQIYATPKITVGEYVIIIEHVYGETSEKVQAQKQIAISNILINQIIIHQTAIAMEVGERTIITYEIVPDSFSDEDLQFTSENEDVATITKGGLITAVGKGQTNITISSLDGKVQANCAITVLQPKIEILEITTNPETLKQGEEGTVKVRILAQDFQSGKNLDIGIYKNEHSVIGNFTIEGNSVQNNEVNLTIIPNKEIVTSGEYKILVTYDGKEINAEEIEKQTRNFRIEADIPVTGIEIEKEKIFITEETERKLQVKIIPENADNRKLIWETDNPDVAWVNEEGILETISKGKAQITVYSDENPEINKTIEIRVIDLIQTEEYTIDSQNKIIKDIPTNTSVEFLLENIQIGSEEYSVTDRTSKVITGETLVGTDMKLNIGAESYSLIVIGDINGDGKISTTDISKLKRHIVELELLTGTALLGADMNANGETTLTDLSRMAEYLVGM